jgi:transcriptional repressor NrdR
MRCPFCGYEETKVIDSRPADSRKRRRRECVKCQKRFTTYEVVEMPLMMVQKKDGSLEPFNREKLQRGIFSAIKKRPVSVTKITKIVDEIANKFANEMRNQVSSREIGDTVLEMLKDIDLVSYIRFASVYKDFTDVDSFIKVISELEHGDMK